MDERVSGSPVGDDAKRGIALGCAWGGVAVLASVISVVAIACGAVVLTMLGQAREDARATRAEISLRAIIDEVVMHQRRNSGESPADIDVLALPPGLTTDPWDNPIVLVVLDHEVVAVSTGPDGVFGSEDDLRRSTDQYGR